MLYKISASLTISGIAMCLAGLTTTILFGQAPAALAVATGVVIAALFICVLLAVWLE